MAYCKNCGAQIDDQATVCSFCCSSQNTAPTTAPAVVDKGGFGWGALGCCIPIVGLILFLVWKDTKPKTAKAAGIGALISAIAGVVVYVLMFALGIASAFMGI